MKGIRANQLLKIGQRIMLRFSLVVYFLIPYFILFTYFNFSFNFNKSELLWALKNSMSQAALASIIVVGLSIPMSQALFLLSKKIQIFITKLLILPQILPALYSVLIAFSLIHPFPMGTVGIVFVFILINLGFATLMTYSLTQERLGNLSWVSEIYSLGRCRFYSKVYFPLIGLDLIAIFFTIFIFCMTSFSVPLLVGGGKGTNLEVLIYEKIFIEQNWSVALGLCFLQSLITFGLSFLILKNEKNKNEVFSAGNYLRSYLGYFFILMYLAFYIGGYGFGVINSLSRIDFVIQYVLEVLEATLFTTWSLFFYLMLNVGILILWLIDYLNNQKFNIAINLIAVSTVIVGFSFYLILPPNKEYDVIKIILACSILFFPSLFKLFLQKPIEGLKSQIMISQIYGLSKTIIIVEIILKQISRSILLWLSFLTIWFISEYAILKSLGVQTQTLGLLAQNFMSGYLLPASYLLSFYMLIYWIVITMVIYFILKAGYVFYKKFIY